jgi:CelD/BcsL family acetyltransferase involved in cellulose biosynthesis
MRVTVSVFDAIEPLEAEWDELCERTAAPPFLRPWWFRAWWAAFGSGRLHVVALHRGGRLAAVLPLARRRGSLVSLSNVHSPGLSIVAEDDAARVELVQMLLASRCRDVCLSFVDAAGATAAAFRETGAAAGRRMVALAAQRSPYVPVDGDWETFERSLASKFVADLRRRRRVLERSGEASVEVEDGSSRLHDLLAEVFAVEPSGWKDARGTAIVSQERTRGFYEDIAAAAARAGCLRLGLLRLDGRLLAFEYALEDGRAWYFLKGGFDPAFRQLAPGKLLAHAMLERAFSSRLASFEFLGALEPWKQGWRPLDRELVLLHAFSASPLGRVGASGVVAWRGVGRPLAKRALRMSRCVRRC